MPAFKKIAISFVVVLALVLVGWIGARVWLYSFLKSDDCRDWLNRTASTATGGDVRFAHLQPHSLDSIYCESVELDLPSPALSAKLEQLRADVRIALLSQSCEITHLDVTRVRLAMAPDAPADRKPSASSPSPAIADTGATAGERPERFRLQAMATEDFNLEWPEGVLRKSRLHASHDSRNAGEWRLEGSGGTVRFLSSPRFSETEWRLQEYKATARPGRFELVNATLRTGQEGTLQLQGSLPEGKSGEWTATFSGIPMETVADGDWRARLGGTLSGTTRAVAPRDGAAITHDGVFEVHEAEVTALPVLDALASWTKTDRFRKLPLHRATARYSGSKDAGYQVSEIVVESSGLVRLEGAMTLHDGRVEGSFQLGLAPGLIGNLPGGRTVFATEREGYLWAPVTLSGPVSSPAEDLSPRLVRAAAGQLMSGDVETIRQGTEGLRKATKGVLETVTPLLPVDPTRLLQ